MSNSQLNELKSRIKNVTKVTLKLSSIVVGDSNNETKFPHKLLLTDIQVWKLRKAISNGSSADLKLSKTQIVRLYNYKDLLVDCLDH